LQFVFTANPEDLYQRGNIVTPLKDRIVPKYSRTIIQNVALPELLQEQKQTDVHLHGS
jgi:Mg-chelatase subunit ChlI